MSNGDDEYHDTTARGVIVILGCSAIISAICSPSGRGQWCGVVWWTRTQLDSTDCKTGSFAYQRHNQHLANSQTHNARVRKPQHTLNHRHTHTHKPTRTRWVHKNPVSGLKDEPTTTAMRYWRAPFARAPQASNLHAFRLVATLHSSYLIARRQELVSLEPRLFLSRSWKPHRDPHLGTTSWWRADDFTATRCEIMSLALVLIGSSCSAC